MIFSLQRMLCIYTVWCFVLPLSSMGGEKPTIIGQLCISQCAAKTAFYVPLEDHTKLTEMGILSCMQCPVIPVDIIQTTPGCTTYLSGRVPEEIYTFESKARGIETNEEFGAALKKKTLPLCIPASYLHCAKTGTVLSFTLHGYPVQLTCCNALQPTTPLSVVSFENDYVAFMAQFIAKPHWHYVDDQEELIAHKLIQEVAPDNYVHGIKGFVSMEKVIRKLIEKRNSSSSKIVLLWIFWKSR
jgi:hypothetical protein